MSFVPVVDEAAAGAGVGRTVVVTNEVTSVMMVEVAAAAGVVLLDSTIELATTI